MQRMRDNDENDEEVWMDTQHNEPYHVVHVTLVGGFMITVLFFILCRHLYVSPPDTQSNDALRTQAMRLCDESTNLRKRKLIN